MKKELLLSGACLFVASCSPNTMESTSQEARPQHQIEHTIEREEPLTRHASEHYEVFHEPPEEASIFVDQLNEKAESPITHLTVEEGLIHQESIVVEVDNCAFELKFDEVDIYLQPVIGLVALSEYFTPEGVEQFAFKNGIFAHNGLEAGLASLELPPDPARAAADLHLGCEYMNRLHGMHEEDEDS